MTGGRRILIIVSVANLAGAQIAALRLAKGLDEKGHDATVIFLYARETIREPDHPYEVVLRVASPNFAGYVRIAVDLLRCVRREKPDAVLTFLPLANAVGQAAALMSGVGKRVVSHRIPLDTAGPIMRWLDTIWARVGVYTDVIAVSGSVKDSCRHYPAKLRERTAVVHNGLRDWRGSRLSREDARRRHSIGGGTLVLVAVGRLAPQKNYRLMIEIVQRLENVLLLIAGDGPDREQTEAMIKQRTLDGKVRLLGALPHSAIPDLLAAGDLFIQTSKFEGQSNAVLEALAAGLPVVAHDIPEQRETIADPDGATAGELVPLGNVEAWVAAIETLRRDPEKLRAARDTATRRAQVFRYETMVGEFERVLVGD